MNLLFPNVATDRYGNRGTWTMIYNQGFEVHINARRYFAFSNYTEADHHQVVSHCDQTMVGWSHDVYVRDWSCYVGRKMNAARRGDRRTTTSTKVHKEPIR